MPFWLLDRQLRFYSMVRIASALSLHCMTSVDFCALAPARQWLVQLVASSLSELFADHGSHAGPASAFLSEAPLD